MKDVMRIFVGTCGAKPAPPKTTCDDDEFYFMKQAFMFAVWTYSVLFTGILIIFHGIFDLGKRLCRSQKGRGRTKPIKNAQFMPGNCDSGPLYKGIEYSAIQLMPQTLLLTIVWLDLQLPR